MTKEPREAADIKLFITERAWSQSLEITAASLLVACVDTVGMESEKAYFILQEHI